jgi:hypothetical protein
MLATAGGAGLMFAGAMLLLGITGLPTTFAELWEESTWRLILDVVCLYILGRMISNGNNVFGVSRPLGYLGCLSGAFAFIAVVGDLVRATVHLSLTAVVLRDLLAPATILGALLLGALLLRTGNIRFAHARRYSAEVVQHPGDLRGLDYSLYLRTFDLDDELSGPQSFTRTKRGLRSLFFIELPQEMQVADALSNDEAPLVGVGRPGEPAPPVGAFRVYLPHADWKPQVRELIEGARHAVLALGWGAGTLWELREAMRILTPEQLILVVPMDQTEYERFRRETAKSLPVRLPAYAGRQEVRSAVRGLITFSDGWAATFVPVRAYSPFHNSLRIALLFAAWPALRRLGYPPRGVLRRTPDASR